MFGFQKKWEHCSHPLNTAKTGDKRRLYEPLGSGKEFCLCPIRHDKHDEKNEVIKHKALKQPHLIVPFAVQSDPWNHFASSCSLKKHQSVELALHNFRWVPQP